MQCQGHQLTLQTEILRGHVGGCGAQPRRDFFFIFLFFSKKFIDFQEEELLSNIRLKNRKPIFIPVSKGSIAFHHGLTVHLASENKSNNTRKAFSIAYFKDNIRKGSVIGNPNPKHFIIDKIE